VLDVRQRENGVRFAVRVQPRASKPGVDGLHGDALKVRLDAAPVDGAANEALVALLAELLLVPRRAVRIVSGLRSRAKVVEVDGIGAEQVRCLAGQSRNEP
jgi:uncharacterized protein (TIGR00251 family)